MDCFAALRPALRRVSLSPVEERYCKGCDCVKPLTEFYANGRRTRSGAEGRSYRCKKCDIRRIKESRRG